MADECTVCGRNDIVTEEGKEPRCSRHVFSGRTYEVEVVVTLSLDGDDEAAYAAVNEIMRRARETDEGRRWIDQKWSFNMIEECVTDITEEAAWT